MPREKSKKAGQPHSNSQSEGKDPERGGGREIEWVRWTRRKKTGPKKAERQNIMEPLRFFTQGNGAGAK